MSTTIAIEKPAAPKTVNREGLAAELEVLKTSRAASLPILEKAIKTTAAKVRATREPYLAAKRANDAARGDLTRHEIDGTRLERLQNRVRDSADPMIFDVVAKIDSRLADLRQTGIKIHTVSSRTLTGGVATKEVSNAAEVAAEMSRLQQARERCESLKLLVGIDAETELGKILTGLEGGK